MVDVLIIGAGLAGLTAGRELLKAGYAVQILEAQQRIGGRLLTLPYKGGALDFGAQWIAPTHRRVLSLVEEFGLTLLPTYKKGKTLYFQINPEQEKQYHDFSFLELLEIFRFKRKLEKFAKSIPLDAPWEAEDALRLDSQSVKAICNQQLKIATANNFIQRKLEEMLCQELSKVSLLDLLWGIRSAGSIRNILKGETYWLKEGTQALAEGLAKTINPSISFGEVVKEVHWENNVVKVYTKTQVWTAKKLIITVPPIAHQRIHYIPPLPPQKENDIGGFQQSYVIKCIIVYDRPFWRENGLNGIAYIGKGPLYLTMDGSFTNGVGILIGIIAGKEAVEFGKLNEIVRREKIIGILTELYGENASNPTEYIEKNWNEDPFSRGGYGAHYPPGILTNSTDPFYQPIGPIHFAGSETASEWRLYMEGALASGERAAKEIIREMY